MNEEMVEIDIQLTEMNDGCDFKLSFCQEGEDSIDFLLPRDVARELAILIVERL